MTRSEIIKILGRYKEQNKGKYGIKHIGVFGSASRDTMSKDSDVDIIVELEKPDMFILANIQATLEKQFGKHVDVIRKRGKMNHFLKKRIEKEVVYV